MVTDMTSGSPMRLLLRFSLPMLVGNIFQQFYSMVDAMIVGRFVGVDALAAVGATGGMSFLVLGFVVKQARAQPQKDDADVCGAVAEDGAKQPRWTVRFTGAAAIP